MRKKALWTAVFALALSALAGCHASEDDPAGLSEELMDNVRRQHAISHLRRLYSAALADNGGDRDAEAVKAISDAAIDNLARAYIENRSDNQNGLQMLELMHEMRDPRAIPALIAALDWTRDVNEQHAVTAARTIKDIEIPADKRGEVISALVSAFEKVRGDRPMDVRIMKSTVEALGSIEHPEATPHLVEIMLDTDSDRTFLINRLAAMQLAELEDPQAVPALIKAQFLFDKNNPAIRLEDVATSALVRIGRPALEPLLDLLRGENEEANALASEFIDALAERDPSVRQNMTPEGYVRERAVISLGSLGLEQALEPLLEESRADSPRRRLTAALALVQLNTDEEHHEKIREAVVRVHNSMPDDYAGLAMRAQLLVAMQHTFDPGYLTLYLEQAKDRDNHPDIRLTANTAYALLANNGEADALRRMIDSEPASQDGGYKERFQEVQPVLDAAEECGEDVSCWIGKLDDSNELVVRKAAYMLGRLARGQEPAIAALVAKLGHSDAQAREDILYALDRVATQGSQAGIDKIDELREREEGTVIWRRVGSTAIGIQGRLGARMHQQQ